MPKQSDIGGAAAQGVRKDVPTPNEAKSKLRKIELPETPVTRVEDKRHNADLLRHFGIDPDKLTAAEIKYAADLFGQVTRNHCFPGANARRPKARAELRTFIAAHPDACKNISVTIDE